MFARACWLQIGFVTAVGALTVILAVPTETKAQFRPPPPGRPAPPGPNPKPPSHPASGAPQWGTNGPGMPAPTPPGPAFGQTPFAQFGGFNLGQLGGYPPGGGGIAGNKIVHGQFGQLAGFGGDNSWGEWLPHTGGITMDQLGQSGQSDLSGGFNLGQLGGFNVGQLGGISPGGGFAGNKIIHGQFGQFGQFGPQSGPSHLGIGYNLGQFGQQGVRFGGMAGFDYLLPGG